MTALAFSVEIHFSDEQEAQIKQRIAKALAQQERVRASQEIRRVNEIERIVRVWAEEINQGSLKRIGPEKITPDVPISEYPCVRTWEVGQVEDALLAIGKGVYYPSRLRELLIHTAYRGLNASDFHLFDHPGRSLPSEVIGLGFRSKTLLNQSLELFEAVLWAGVERNPKPERAKEFERS